MIARVPVVCRLWIVDTQPPAPPPPRPLAFVLCGFVFLWEEWGVLVVMLRYRLGLVLVGDGMWFLYVCL